MADGATETACSVCGCTGGSLSKYCNAYRERTVSLALAADRSRIAQAIREDVDTYGTTMEECAMRDRLLRVVEG